MYHNTNTIYNEICQPKREKKRNVQTAYSLLASYILQLMLNDR